MGDEVRWLSEVALDDVAEVGGKGANLGELTRAGLRVPPGFVVTAPAFGAAMELGGARDELRARLDAALAAVDEPSSLATTAAELRELVRSVGVPASLVSPLLDAFHRLGDDEPVAVRSSATAEDAEGISFAGMHDTFLNVVGDDALLERIVECWVSLFGDRAIAYRAGRRLVDEPSIAVVVQSMVHSRRAGVMFTEDPAGGGTGQIVIEAARGLGEVVVSGQVEPDTYVVSEHGQRLARIRVGEQHHELVSEPDGTLERRAIDPDRSRGRVLTDDEAMAVARLGLEVEAHYGGPRDVEWAIDDDARIHLVQCRPITTRGGSVGRAAVAGPGTARPAATGGRAHDRGGPSADRPPAVQGIAASSGIATGAVRVLEDPTEGMQLGAGEVLVAPMTDPGWVPAIRRAAAVVTDSGGMTCHAAIVSRELGVPCVVGTRRATAELSDGDVVTVDGSKGTVHLGPPAEPPS